MTANRDPAAPQPDRAADATLDATRRAIEAVWRIEAPRLIATLARFTRDLGQAEDLAQEALLAALERWPASGIPERPAAWLLTTARNRALDGYRHGQLAARKQAAIAYESPASTTEDLEAVERRLDDDVGDDLLRLLFVACHPALPTESQVALTLRLLGGLTTAEIARAFLVAEPAVAQRIVRAKRTLAAAGVRFELPRGEERLERLGSVLEVLYLVFNEGYTATAGASWTRPDLCFEALRLGRVLAGLLPGESEVHGLVALMELQASRLAARHAADGSPILLLDQDRRRWDPVLIRRGLAALERARSLGGGRRPYALEAAIAACHARARSADATDWTSIAALYETLAEVAPSPVVELNRAVAVGMAHGPAAALELVDQLCGERRLEGYHLLPAVRADLLGKLGRQAEAAAELDRAATLARNDRERALLRERADTLRRGTVAG
jgi:RNA polymerase sigma-70 factor (ECF subfamily)